MTDDVSQAGIRRANLLRGYGLIDGGRAPAEFEEIVRLAAQLCDTPMAALSVNDESSERFIFCHGVALDRIGVNEGFSEYIVSGGFPVLVSDTRVDPRFRNAPLLAEVPELRFYAGVPVIHPDGVSIGTLAVMDTSIRHLPQEKLAALATLASQIITQLELERSRQAMPREAGREPGAMVAKADVDFRALFDAVPGLFWVVEPKAFRIVAASDAFLRSVHAQRSEVIGKPLFDVFPEPPHSENGTSLRESLERVKSTGQPDDMLLHRYPVPRPAAMGGGFEERYWNSTNAPVLNRSGDLRYIIHRTQDVTRHVHAKTSDDVSRQLADPAEADLVARAQDLKRVNEHLRFAQRVANIGSWEYDITDGRRTWSDEVYRILGLDRAAIPEGEEALRLVVHPDDQEMLAEARRRAIAGEGDMEFEHRIVRPDGRIRHVRERAELISDDEGNPLRLFGTIQDITDQKLTEERLRRSEILLHIAGRMAKIGGWQLDVPEQRMFWSDDVCAIHEIAPCASMSISDATSYVAPEWRDKVNEAINACIRSGTPYDMEIEIITAKGRRIWARAIGQAVRSESGTVTCIQGALQDITAEKQAEADVQRLADRLVNTFESITDGFITLDREWRVTYMNARAEQILVRPRGELVGRMIWDEYGEFIDSRSYREYHRAIAENRTVTFEEFYSPRNVWIDITAYPSPEGLAIYFRDVTERKRDQEALRESEARTRAIVDTALDAVISIDANSVIDEWNPQAEATFGWSRDEVLGKFLYDTIIPPEYRERHIQGLEHYKKTGEGPLLHRRVEVEALHRDGRRFPVELSISPVQTRGAFCFSAFVRDISDRKRHEASLRESEERFRIVARATAEIIWDWNLVTDTIWWNDGMKTVFGYDPENLEPDSRSWTERIHPEDRERVVDSVHSAINGSEDEWREEYRFLRKDGSIAYVVDKGFIIRDETGKAIRMVGGIDDITEKKAYETTLQRQAALLDKAHEAIIVLDVEGRITYWNKSAERQYGWTEAEALGKHKADLLHEDKTQFAESLRKLFATGEWNGVVRQVRKDGSSLTVEATWSLVTDDDGRPEAVFSIITDISQRLALEEQLRQAQRLESIGKLTGGVAHDFNNLLTVILGNAELMADQLPEGGHLYKLARMTRSAARRGAELTHRLLAFARRQTLAPAVIDVNQLVLGMESLLRRTLLENIELEVMPADDAWPAFADPGQLESVLLNLAINAKDAMENGGRLTIETANVNLDESYAENHAEVTPGPYVMIAVSDTGHGISPENLGRVFDPFFTTKEKGKGTGLGLSMAYGFAKQSRGHINIYSEPGEGTTVKLYLPRAEHVSDAPEPEPDTERDLSGTEKVLIVEDDDLVREHARDQLADLGYDVLTARNGPEAMEIIRREPDIDLLFTDVIMSGGMNGRELAEMAHRVRPELKVLYTSGYTENAIVHHGQLDRGVQLLQKPYQRADLAKKLRSALNHSTPRGTTRSDANARPRTDPR